MQIAISKPSRCTFLVWPGSPWIILLFPPVDFSALQAHAITYDISGTPVVVASIDDLITLKEAVGRPIDRADIDHLRRLAES